MKTITPENANKLMNMDKQAFVDAFLNGEYHFDNEYIYYCKRWRWSGWWPRKEQYILISDGVNKIEFV